MKRRFAVMAAALTMIILTGCGKGELQTGKESMEENLKKETVESAGEVQNMPTDEIDIWEPYEETITIHTVTTEGDQVHILKEMMSQIMSGYESIRIVLILK